MPYNALALKKIIKEKTEIKTNCKGLGMDKMKGQVGPSLSSIPATSVGSGF